MDTFDDYARFYEWDGVAEKWIRKEEAFDMDFPSKPSVEGKSVAAWIIQDVFNLNLSSSSDIGSSLPGYDIKNRDAYQMIQLSLAGELLNEKLYECYADENGSIRFYEIGSNSADLDILYAIKGSTLTRNCDLVVVSGYDHPPKKYTGKEFDLLIYANDIDYTDIPFYDRMYPTNYPEYIVWGDEFGPELCDYYKEGYIVYGNPYFDQKNILVKQGVYDPKKFESIVSFIYKIDIPFYEAGHTNVSFSTTSPRIERLPSFGKLQRKNLMVNNKYMPDVCREGSYPDPDKGVLLPYSDDPRFLGVRAVYIYGYKIKLVRPAHYREGDNRIDGEEDFIIDVDTTKSEPFALSAGTDYIVTKDPEGGNKYRIVFSCEVTDEYLDKFGGDVDNIEARKAKVKISPASIREKGDITKYADLKAVLDYATSGKQVSVYGVLADGVTDVNSDESFPVSLFPLSEGKMAYGVDRILVVYDWDEPCIHITDDRNIVTRENLESVSIKFYPLISKDPPPPIATQDKILNPSEAIPDEDVTTVEDLQSTEYNRVLSSLEAGDIKLNLPFIDNAEDCLKVAKFVKGLQDKVAQNVTYVCSPESNPRLGDVIEDNLIINSITYSYQDSNSYFINVQAGPIWKGMSSWETALYRNKTEQIQLPGKVLSVHEDNSKCYVLLDKLGLMECINQTKEILQKGDRVSVTVYNNPVEK